MPNVSPRHKPGHPPAFRVTIMETTLIDRSTQRVLPLMPAILLAMLVGMNLRPSMAAIGPLVERIQADIAISYAQLALLTTLPVLAMGAGCFIAVALARRCGADRLIGGSLLMIALADGLRLAGHGVATLLITALVAGIGIAGIQALLPALIKQQARQRTPLVMGWYIAAIMGGAALAATLAATLADLTGSWRASLALWGLVALVAFLAWQRRGPVLPDTGKDKEQHDRRASLYRQPRVWTLAIFFSLCASGYACVLAWLPPYYMELGWTESAAGLLLGYLTALEVVAGLVLPALAQRRADRRPVLFIPLTCSLAGFLLLWHTPDSSPWFITTLLGIGLGGLFPLSLIVSMDHHPDAQRAGDITAIAQGAGYSLGALTPLIAGVIRDQLGGFEWAWAGLAGTTLLMALIALRFDPRHFSTVIRD
ncbi:MFS transporter [Halomonas elongata]|uniref:MFS transporter n=1 Tax=Halomonas elongata TaxID=2746 RepID=UPI00403386F4